MSINTNMYTYACMFVYICNTNIHAYVYMSCVNVHIFNIIHTCINIYTYYMFVSYYKKPLQEKHNLENPQRLEVNGPTSIESDSNLLKERSKEIFSKDREREKRKILGYYVYKQQIIREYLTSQKIKIIQDEKKRTLTS